MAAFQWISGCQALFSIGPRKILYSPHCPSLLSPGFIFLLCPSLHPFSISAECDLGSKLLRVKIRASRMSYVHHTVIA